MARSTLMVFANRMNELKAWVDALSDDERNFILDLLAPEPEQVEQPKKTKKRVRKVGKSTKAQSLAGAIKGAVGSNDKPSYCRWVSPKSQLVCGGYENDQIHDKDAGYLDYHPFTVTEPAAASSAGGG